jgi:AcrR family transcriptional regulator
MNTTPAPSPRERILDTAARLFYSDGVRAVGVDTIIAEADVAKMTFYKHFASKDNLVAEVLRRRSAEWRAWMDAAVRRLAAAPRDRPLAVFDALGERFSAKGFRGCAFNNAVIELADRDHAAHRAAVEHKALVRALLRSFLEEAGAVSADALAGEFLLLMDGALVTAVRDGRPDAALSARNIAAALLAADKRERRRS